MTDTAASAQARARRLGLARQLEGKLSWIALGLVGLLLPLLDDSYIGVIAQRAYIYWILSAGLNLVVGYAGQIAIGWVSMLTLGAYTTAALAAGRVGGRMASLSRADRGRRRSARCSASSSACRRSGCAPSTSP